MSVSSQPFDLTDLQLRSLLDAFPVGMLVFNDRLEVVLANPPAESLFGIADGQQTARRCGDAVSCANRLKSPSGCGYSEACPSCPLFRGLNRHLPAPLRRRTRKAKWSCTGRRDAPPCGSASRSGR